MAKIHIDEKQVNDLIRLGFAPVFRSLAGILRDAVRAGAQQLYYALTHDGFPVSYTNTLYAQKQAVLVSDEVLLEMVSETPSFDSLPEVLQRAAKAGAKQMYEGLGVDDQQRANNLFNDFFKPYVDPMKVDGIPGMLSYEEIVVIVENNTVVKFDYSSDPIVSVEAGNIMLRRPGYPEYTFNEHGAADAVYDGNRLSMPDAQGFPCTFEFK